MSHIDSPAEPWSPERVRSATSTELAAALLALAEMPAPRIEAEHLAHLVAGFAGSFDEPLIEAMLPFPAEHARLAANRHFPLDGVDSLLASHGDAPGTLSVVGQVLAVAARRGGHPVPPAAARRLLQLEPSSARESAALAHLRVFTEAEEQGVTSAEEINRRVRDHYAAAEMSHAAPVDRDHGGRLLVENPCSTPAQAIALLAELPSPTLAGVIGAIIVDGTREDFAESGDLIAALRPYVEEIQVAQALMIAGATLEDVVRGFDVLAETEYLSETIVDERISVEMIGRLGPARAARMFADPDPEVHNRAALAFGEGEV